MRTSLLKARTWMGFAAGLVLGLTSPVSAQRYIVSVDGSSTVYPVTEAVAEEFQKAHPNIHVTVGISGTGGGFKKFVRGEIDATAASRPIARTEMEQARNNGIEYLELPICFDALTVVVSRENTFVDFLTVEELKRIWEPEAQGKILYWNQVRPNWPREKIVLYGAGPDSGTFDYFTEAIVGKARSSRGDYTASEDDNVLVRGVEGSPYALGYFGYAYYAAHAKRLRAVPIDWDKDTLGPVEPKTETVIAGTYNPLSRPLFIYVNRQSVENKPHVRQFVEYYLTHVPRLAAEVKYVPLPEAEYGLVMARFKKMETGTAFGGEAAAGVPVAEVMSRPLQR